jgi:hypothetical protein
MRSILISILILATVVAAGFLHGVDAAQAQAEQHLFVTTAEGQVYGVVQAGIASFKGIPYAAPPTADGRWRPPQPAAFRSEILLAGDYGPPCLQPPLPDAPGLKAASEDCLTINVFRPFEVENPLPVMVWFHGGSFADGAGGDPLSDGSRLAGEGVIVVTFNYRLGPLGWLADPLRSHEAADPDANLGMMDQIAALRWVAENIGATPATSPCLETRQAVPRWRCSWCRKRRPVCFRRRSSSPGSFASGRGRLPRPKPSVTRSCGFLASRGIRRSRASLARNSCLPPR